MTKDTHALYGLMSLSKPGPTHF